MLAAFVLTAPAGPPARAQARSQNKPSPPAPQSSDDYPIEILSATDGVNFLGYADKKVLPRIKQRWTLLIPDGAKGPYNESGEVVISFSIQKDGSVSDLKLDQSCGIEPLDRAARGGITTSVPFPPFPQEFSGDFVRFKFHFHYNNRQKSAKN